MALMRVTTRSGRYDAGGKHNDRNFNLDDAPHIDQDRVSENRYYTYYGDDAHTLEEVELGFYDQHFSQIIEEQNARNVRFRHKDRNRTLESYYRGKRTRPEDIILQVGNINEHASAEELWDCATDYAARFDDIWGDHCKILTMALHADEATPHVHIRRVWIAEDENGVEYVSQNKALEQMGYTLPHPARPEGKFNNRKIAFTSNDRALFLEVCKERGLDIEAEPVKGRRHLETEEYKLSQEVMHLQKERDSISEEICQISENVSMMNALLNMLIEFFRRREMVLRKYRLTMADIEARSKMEQLYVLSQIYEKELGSSLRIAQGFDLAMQFIEENGLLEDFKRQAEKHARKEGRNHDER